MINLHSLRAKPVLINFDTFVDKLDDTKTLAQAREAYRLYRVNYQREHDNYIQEINIRRSDIKEYCHEFEKHQLVELIATLMVDKSDKQIHQFLALITLATDPKPIPIAWPTPMANEL